MLEVIAAVEKSLMTDKSYSKPLSFVIYSPTHRPCNSLISHYYYPYFKATCYNLLQQQAKISQEGTQVHTHTHT